MDMKDIVKKQNDLFQKNITKSVKYRKTVHLYEQMERKDMVAQLLAQAGIVITCFSVEGDTLENYFVSMIGGEKNVQSY